MRKEKKAVLDVLAKASDVHNCWAILDDAVTSGEDDQFTKEYIEGEREMLEGSIKGTIRALGALGGFYGIVVSTQNDNGSYAYMRKVREEHLTELERAKEFDRGYRAGQRAMDAERQAIALKLRGLDLTGSSHENLSKMAYAIYPCATGWTPESCDGLREYVVRLIGGVTEPFMSAERIMEAEDRAYESGFRGGKAECDHGDCAERRRTGAVGGDTDVDEPAEIRAVSDGISDMLRKMDNGHSRTCPKSGDEVSESAPSVSIVDELRDCVERATKTYDDAAWYDVDDEDEHTWCSITVAEIDGIADRIEEQFARVCQQQEAVLLKQMDQQRAMLTEQRDAARAKVIGLCNECDKLQAMNKDLTAKLIAARKSHMEMKDAIVSKNAECLDWYDKYLDALDKYGDMKCERDNLLDLLRDAVVDFKNASYGWNYAAVVSENITIETERNRLAKERDTLQKWLDDMREQREHWADEATKMYRLFFSHDEYCVPDNPSEMVAVAVRTLQAKLDEIKSVLATDETEVSDAC